jgi:hypothetical protein
MTTHAEEMAVLEPVGDLELITVLTDDKGRPLVEWCPNDSDYDRRAGAVLIHDGRKVHAYALSESAGDDGRRAVRFDKLTAGTDASESHYWLSCTQTGEQVQCECRGFVRHSHCKHALALGLLVAGGLV